MKNLFKLFALAGLLAASACAKNTEPGLSGNTINFKLELTKATATSFENGDEVSLFAGDPVNATDVKLTFNNGNITPERTLYWGEGQTKATTFEAIYPYDATLTSADFDFLVKTDQSIEKELKASDLMYATTSQTPGKTVSLNFTHQLSKVTVTVDNKTAATVESVSTGAVKTAYNPVSKTSSGSAAVKGFNAGSGNWTFLLAPQNTSGTIVVTTSDGTYEFKGDFKLESGKKYGCTVVIEAGKPTPTPDPAAFSCTVSDWEDGATLTFVQGGNKDVVKASVAEFLKAADPATLYELKGTVSNFNSKYCSFDLSDGTGSIYVYSVDAASKTAFGSKVKDGSTVTLQGYYYVYQPKEGTPTIEIKDAKIISCEGGQEEDPSLWEKAAAKTVKEFITAAATGTYYKLTGTISDYVAANCRFTLTDASGSIKVFQVVNSSDWASKMHEGGTVTIAGKYQLYNESEHELVSGHVLAYDASTEKPVEDLKHPLTSGITWTLGSQAYDNTSSGQSKQSATVNGKTVDNLLKLASSSKAGNATLTIPSGVTKIGLYVAGWEETTLTVGSKSVSVPKTNGCTGNAPYTLTLSDDVNYVEVPVSGSSVEVSCSVRVLLIGINAI